MAVLSDTDLETAERKGRAHLERDPRATAARFDPASGRIVVDLANGCAYAFPPALVQDLQGASPSDLAEIDVDGVGFNIHWPRLDVDLYVPGLVAGLFGTRDWMRRELARVAGQTTSVAKSKAARANGAKGGRPRKSA